jgi:hypothetical protein
MELTVNSKIIADANVQRVQVRQLVGSFELSFSIEVSVHSMRDLARWILLHSARVTARSTKGAQMEVGRLAPDKPVLVQQLTNTTQLSAQFSIALLPQQLAALEDQRDGGDLDFEIAMSGTGGDDKTGQVPTNATLWHRAPRSQWVAQLNGAGAANILLLEVPMPLIEPAASARAIDQHLRQAHKHFLDGSYRECVSECRQVTEELGRVSSGDPYKQLGNRTDREAMTKEEREDAVVAVIQTYAHLSAHSPSRGGVMDFTRSDAKLILSLTAALVAHRASRGQ